MNIQQDLHVEISKYQNKVSSYLGLNPDQLLFEFSSYEGKVRLDLITVNQRHNQSFLFRYEVGFDKIDVLSKILNYVEHIKDEEDSFTIQWMKKGAKEIETSYFRGRNILDSLDKFHYGRDLNTITIFSIILNPKA
jgi:hypothetical protein